MKKLLSITFLAFLCGIVFLTSCDNGSDPKPQAEEPVITAPSRSNVQVNTSLVLPFQVDVPGGFSTSEVSTTIGSASIKSNLTSGETSGIIEVEFDAGDNLDKEASIILTVTDQEGDSDESTIILSITTQATVIGITTNISEDVTWDNSKVYLIEGRITVLDGATLTIEPGTIIKGESGTGSNAKALVIARGGKLMAEGTAEAPIIFTAAADEIEPGMIESPNLDPDINGLWGGVIVLGYGYINASASEIQIEGIPPSDTNGLYGGNDDTDNSGTITYISIRHGGANIGAGNEINGLSLGGVGSGTIINNVEIVANQDDGIEWFGGSVDITNALIWNVGDDGMDTDQAWNGTMDDYIIVNPTGSCFELDGPEGDDAAYFASARTPLNHSFINGTVYVGMSPAAIDFDVDTNVDIDNIYFFGFNDAASAQAVQEYAGMVDFAGGSLTNVEVTLPAGFTSAEIFVDVPAENISEVAVNENTVGASGDYSWTWASQSGALEEIGL